MTIGTTQPGARAFSPRARQALKTAAKGAAYGAAASSLGLLFGLTPMGKEIGLNFPGFIPSGIAGGAIGQLTQDFHDASTGERIMYGILDGVAGVGIAVNTALLIASGSLPSGMVGMGLAVGIGAAAGALWHVLSPRGGVFK